MRLKTIRFHARWLSQLTGLTFLLVCAYVMGQEYTFYDGRIIKAVKYTALTSAGLTLVFGLLSLPRWQGFVALGIFAYAVYWFSTHSLHIA